MNKHISIDENWKTTDGYKCPHCNKIYSRMGISTHILRAHTNVKFSSGYNDKYDTVQFLQRVKENGEKTNFRLYGPKISETVKCYKCGKEFIYTSRKKKFNKKKKFFCSRPCANSRAFLHRKLSLESKKKLSESLKKAWADGLFDNKKQAKIFSSKNERYIVKYFKENFPDDNWKSGGQLKIADSKSISRDMWSDKLKVCFEYDGIWHFKNIHNQLKDKQEKDALLEKWCIENNYRLVRIDEDSFLNIEQVIAAIYKNSERTLKIGSRY